ncbi:MAG: IS200/IS605 family transposase [Bacteroidetes bacterium]|nr:IS200/IS605 family transposase [Bacteroidota bacterium]
MPFVKMWVHIVWTTKRRQKLLSKEIRPLIFKHIHTNALQNNILMDSVGGYEEHVHSLFRLRNNQTLSEVMRLIKGESSHWINKENLILGKFKWQEDYYAVSVSESQVVRVRNYIEQQELHHGKMTFEEEYDNFIRKYGFKLKG